MVSNIRKKMYDGRDLNEDKDEPLLASCHCICFDAQGKVCKNKATAGPYCAKHTPKANKM